MHLFGVFSLPGHSLKVKPNSKVTSKVFVTNKKGLNEETWESKLNEKRIRIKRASGDIEKSSPISLVSHSLRSSVTVEQRSAGDSDGRSQ